MASFFLIQADVGQADRLAALLARLPGVIDVCVTSGPYDVVAEVTTSAEHQQQLRAAVRGAPGLSRLSVCHESKRRRLAAS